MSFVYFSTNYAKKDLGYNYQKIEEDTNGLGLFEKDDYISLDWIVVLKDYSIELIKLSHLRNLSKNSH
jgi:hypothetical protein